MAWTTKWLIAALLVTSAGCELRLRDRAQEPAPLTDGSVADGGSGGASGGGDGDGPGPGGDGDGDGAGIDDECPDNAVAIDDMDAGVVGELPDGLEVVDFEDNPVPIDDVTMPGNVDSGGYRFEVTGDRAYLGRGEIFHTTAELGTEPVCFNGSTFLYTFATYEREGPEPGWKDPEITMSRIDGAPFDLHQFDIAMTLWSAGATRVRMVGTPADGSAVVERELVIDLIPDGKCGARPGCMAGNECGPIGTCDPDATCTQADFECPSPVACGGPDFQVERLGDAWRGLSSVTWVALEGEREREWVIDHLHVARAD